MGLRFGHLVSIAVAILAASAPPGLTDGPGKGGRLVFESPRGVRLELQGAMGERVERNIDQWLLTAVDANPGMLEMLRVRDRQPVPDIMPWAGEFVGKYLLTAVQACRMSDLPELREQVRRTVAELISTQAADGYLGPFRKEERLLGHWDLWGHYHCMIALLEWYEDTGDRAALDCAIRAADLICKTFLDSGKRVLEAGSPEMNMAVIHSLARLYRLTGEERYLRMARDIEQDWESAGDYLRTGRQGVDFYRTPRPRWESLHDLEGLVELYRITGDEGYRQAFVNLWTSIMQHDRHPSGGFSTGEQAVGNPYTPGAIETCCTTAWIALTEDMLRLTGSSLAADELELSTWNSVLASQHPSGRWWTYDTPLNGVRQASAHAIVFQARFGTPELNCCSVNGPRILGLISDWAVMSHQGGLALNYYGPGSIRAPLPSGRSLTILQETDYPLESRIGLTLQLDQAERFVLSLRIPHWSERSAVRVNDEQVADVRPGRYLRLDRTWKPGDRIVLDLDFRLHFWVQEEVPVAGQTPAEERPPSASIYRGPILLAFDPRFNLEGDVPVLDADGLVGTRVESDNWLKPWMLLEFPVGAGRTLRLCDFGSAGTAGHAYRSWLPVRFSRRPEAGFSRERPLRSFRAKRGEQS